jgi:alpha-D-ribose 1-methylphosphonate 5-triphosphate synthase subunit PhnH
MTLHDLSSIGAGFSDETLGSQTVFRAALEALSHPGRCIEVGHDAQVPKHGHAASAVLLLALLDVDCMLWLSPSLKNTDAATWLHFHTGCQLVDDATLAHFAWVAQGDAIPPLSAFAQGSDNYPDQSTTCVVDVSTINAATHDAETWILRGPGIEHTCPAHIEGLSTNFLTEWAANHATFPCGIDLLFATSKQIMGLPRTTSIDKVGRN